MLEMKLTQKNINCYIHIITDKYVETEQNPHLLLSMMELK